jgi:hypothetical protein
VLYCNGKPGFFPREIQKFQAMEYPVEIAQYHHAMMIKSITDDKIIVEEEKQMFDSCGETDFNDYLKQDSCKLMVREPITGLPLSMQGVLFDLMTADKNAGIYNIPGIFNFAYKYIAYKCTGKAKWLNVGNNKNMEVCSQKVEEWYKEAYGIANSAIFLQAMKALMDDNYTMSPADFVASLLFKTICVV